MARCLFNFFHLFSLGPKEMLNKRGRPLIGTQFTEVQQAKNFTFPQILQQLIHLYEDLQKTVVKMFMQFSI